MACMKDGCLCGYETIVSREIIFPAKNTILGWSEQINVLQLNWKVSTHSVKQVYKSRSQPTLCQQTLSTVHLSRGEPDKLDLCYLCVSHLTSHRSHETRGCICIYFCTQILEICCREDQFFFFGVTARPWTCPLLLFVDCFIFFFFLLLS